MSLRAVAVLVTLSLASCVLPLNVSEPGSPSLVGILMRSDGLPAVGTRVAITNDYSGKSCPHVNAREFSDSSGTFRFAPTTYVQRWVVIIPPIEKFANYYAVCSGVDDSLFARAYEGRVSIGYQQAPARDTLRCVEWAWEGHSRVTCNGPGADDRIQSSGTWSDTGGSGFYRLIVVRTMFDQPHVGVYLQWVQHTQSYPPQLVRQTIALPLPAKLISLDEVKLSWMSTGPCIDLHGILPAAHWYSWSANELHEVLAFGAPGDIRNVSECP